ncbi:hypothetical protein MLD38_017342 [Melastoma candidum]|uniref:Uncharacterized protein n=1 Tax=Melastoma candidum TaxID=119954 RepID=A0ACB9QQE4_9MYRT|nr:hypothetical protein MLD38_017342 [Melastoma candidum]
MRPSEGRLTRHVLELVLACLTMAFLFIGLCGILCRKGRRFDCGRFADCWKKPGWRFLPYSAATGGGVKQAVVDIRRDGIGDDKDVEAVAKAFGDEGDEGEEELSDYMFATGLIGLQSRILFTIMEESKEDMDSDCGRSSRGELSKRLSFTRSLSDVGSRSSRRMFESIPPTPPSRFKFLRDADEKFRMRLKQEAEERALGFRLPSQLMLSGRDDSWLKIAERRKDIDPFPQIVQNHPSSSSRVLPLESSPPY